MGGRFFFLKRGERALICSPAAEGNFGYIFLFNVKMGGKNRIILYLQDPHHYLFYWCKYRNRQVWSWRERINESYCSEFKKRDDSLKLGRRAAVWIN